jgi:hypothetical protein
MKDRLFRRTFMVLMLCFAVIASGALMIGCKGSDGAQGAQGPAGPPGTGTQAAANEQCLLCHGPGAIAAIAVVHTTSPLSATTEPLTVDGTNVDINEQAAPQLAGLTMVGTVNSITFSAGTTTVTFSVKSGTNGVIGLTTTQVRFAIAKLVSAASGTYWQSYQVPTATSRPGNDSGGTMTDNLNGTYVYTFGTNLTTVPGVTFDANATHRLAIQISGTVSGGSLNDRAINIIQDYVPANLPAFTGTTAHDIVTAATCNTCHYKIGTTTPHGGRVDTKYCVVCHTYQRENGRAASAPTSTG